MKTSKYILRAFFIFIFGSILTLYVTSRFHDEDEQFKFLKNDLPRFSFIVAEPGSNFQVKSDTAHSISAAVLNDDTTFQFPDYVIKADTLFVHKHNSYSSPCIHCCNLKEIIGKKDSRIGLKGIEVDKLIIQADGCQINSHSKKNNIKQLDMLAHNHSSLYFSNVRINLATIKADQSKIQVWRAKIDTLVATISNKSSIRASANCILKIDFDESSKYDLRN